MFKMKINDEVKFVLVILIVVCCTRFYEYKFNKVEIDDTWIIRCDDNPCKTSMDKVVIMDIKDGYVEYINNYPSQHIDSETMEFFTSYRIYSEKIKFFKMKYEKVKGD